MNGNQINRKEMQNAVRDYLDAHVTKWSTIAKIGEFKNEFDLLNDQIDQTQQAQQAAQVFVGKNKKIVKSTIAQKADILNDVLETFGMLSGDTELEKNMGESYSDLQNMRNLDFIPKINTIISEAEKHLTVLQADYGVTPEQIEDLKADMDQFLELNGQPRAYRIASVRATKDLEQLFSEINLVLTEKLDRVMKIFKRRDPNFYNGYRAARVVVNN
ncbi:hypothetical protein [uncultured Sunxiuqinia sp.]|uniref:hypothetical protein n=1 Tax=uncultured Sunxiuqinia sp. TaxID=1573825 RepID=UPI00260512DC|nr:hypothetical protein [uncultured Sunxiuqinia sp.]